MSTIEEIKAAIESLPKSDYLALRDWLSEREWNTWDRQIESDSAAGKLDFLANEALAEKANGNLKDL